ncbi:hypothetical protein Ddye_014701 [Dipteronia dyeriana]|uniref:Jacalin-type lectin domain-containing protein n=1 Tax=Dipteronia dyeriana TaxID=168575 RepID=A0AAD9X8R6_9ROSI|nr:hypothetical protein Ddye_014701 [Dipteronia dyeriana]
MGSTHDQDLSSIKGELWGGQGGRDWHYRPVNGIVEITIVYTDVIDSLHFKHAIGYGTNKSTENFGGHGGKKRTTILFDWPNEYLTEISGSTGTFNRDEVIGTLSFTTNRNNKYGPFGSVNDGKPFEFISKKNGAIVGFFGRQGNFIDALGVYYKGPPSPIVAKVNSALTMDKDDIPLDVGPWGGNKGKSWNGGRFQGRIIEIDVHVRNGVIRAIQYRYEIGSPLVVSSIKHGGEVADRASTTYRIILDKDNNSPEELVGISGFYGAFDANCCEYQVVQSISFYTNKGKYGPFGTEIGTFFNSPVCTNAKVVGFHGRSGEYLDAIGVHVQYLSSSTPEQPIIDGTEIVVCAKFASINAICFGLNYLNKYLHACVLGCLLCYFCVRQSFGNVH